eukprot:TRINITY_DN68323_c0_g1_i1.p1 TRINITY_DN68323_c0_g1~~TRINITY_DN68323_c0_g1_i1.p1  ORF type:complete len:628 (-),score=33.46 TRINITY_DN68323_c0_g1_i1:96-1979(-)
MPSPSPKTMKNLTTKPVLGDRVRARSPPTREARRPFKSGVHDIDIEVSIITRSLDRVVTKKLENLAITDPRSPPSSPPADEKPNNLPPLQKAAANMSFIPHTGTIVPNPNVSHGLEFEVDMVVKALERIVHKTLDLNESEMRQSAETNALKAEIERLKHENGALAVKLAAATASKEALDSEVKELRKKSLSSHGSRPHTPGGDPAWGSRPASRQGLEPLPAEQVLSQQGAELVPANDNFQHAKPSGEIVGGTGAIPIDNSFWGVVLQIMRFGKGDYEIHVLNSNPKLHIVNESKPWALEYLADAMLNMRNSVVVIKEIRSPRSDTFGPRTHPRNLGIGLDLDIIQYDSCKAEETFMQSSMETTTQRPWSRGSAVGVGQVVGDRSISPSSHGRPVSTHVGRPPTPNDRGKSAFERYGILHYIGTNFGQEDWQNPAVTKRVVSHSSSIWGFGDVQDVSKKDLAYFITRNAAGSWVEIDILCGVLMPFAYSFASAHPIYSGYYPRNWELQGSRDKKQWVVLKKHENDDAVTHQTPFGFWDITLDDETTSPPSVSYFRHFRILQTGPNSFGTHELQISAFEFYGRFVHMMEDEPRPPPPPCLEEPRPTDMEEDLPLPPQPKPPKPRGKKKK